MHKHFISGLCVVRWELNRAFGIWWLKKSYPHQKRILFVLLRPKRKRKPLLHSFSKVIRQELVSAIAKLHRLVEKLFGRPAVRWARGRYWCQVDVKVFTEFKSGSLRRDETARGPSMKLSTMWITRQYRNRQCENRSVQEMDSPSFEWRVVLSKCESHFWKKGNAGNKEVEGLSQPCVMALFSMTVVLKLEVS